jgi:hypothetical protein
VPWVEVFAVLVISHLVGDFLVQTEWQASNKLGGLSGPPTARRALLAHITTYTLCFVPALIWLAGSIGWAAVGIGVLIAVPHYVQDDGRLLSAYLLRVKRTPSAQPGDLLYVAVDQAFHLLALFCVALLAAA